MAPVRLLAARYELHAVLGSGGMAAVWRGTDRRLGRTVAVKVLRTDLAQDPEFQERFHREALAVAGLNHRSIVAVYDTGVDRCNGDPVPFIVMEHLDGTTLRQIFNEGPLLADRALAITAEVLDALAYSHQHGIVHRDIKPGNIMVTTSGAVKVMDFGIARVIADLSVSLTRTAAVIGTAQYLSPEQARGRRIDARSDVYSTGCMLYELLTGRPPFLGDSPIAVACKQVQDEPVSPCDLDPGMSEEHAAIAMRALRKDPDERYQSAAEMRDAICAVLAGEHLETVETVESDDVVTTEEAVLAIGNVTEMSAASGPDLEPGLAAIARPASRRRTYALFSVAFAAVIAMAAIGITRLSETPSPSGGEPAGRVSAPATPTHGGHHATPRPTDLSLDNRRTGEQGKRRAPTADATDTATPAQDATATPDTASPTPSPGPTKTSGSPKPTPSTSPSPSDSPSPSESPTKSPAAQN